jgi:hypothetical protein
MITESGGWNEEIIRQVFIPIDAEAILLMPRGRGVQDFWAWNLEKFGAYTVKSAYKFSINQHGTRALFALGALDSSAVRCIEASPHCVKPISLIFPP